MFPKSWIFCIGAVFIACSLAFVAPETLQPHYHHLVFASTLSVLSCLVTWKLIPVFGKVNRDRGMFGRDLCKTSNEKIPESLGIVPGLVFICVVTALQFVFHVTNREMLVEYNAGTLSICLMLFLGFVDDVLDIPWRYKIVLPFVATVPLLCAYSGSTTIVIPKFLHFIFVNKEMEYNFVGKLIGKLFDLSHGNLLDLGLMYFVYIALVAVFCTNAINIYAGINGLEVGQSLVIAICCLLTNVVDIVSGYYDNVSFSIFSLMLLLPFVSVSAALFDFNSFPATVFVGDTYCYFAGMTLAVAGILGHFSKTLLLLFLPQIINFLLSTPQLFKFLPCPRHRLPRFNATTGLLEPSTFIVPPSKKRRRKLKLEDNEEETEPKEMINLTLINLILKLFGPMKESTLCTVLLGFQGFVGLIVIIVRSIIMESDSIW